jgi:NAD-dependent dihydropyrimidine dehydrogenase PreA subunit
VPTIVETFVEKLDLASAEYLFAIATRGGTRTMALSELDKILKKKGRRLDSFFLLTMPAGTEPLIARYARMITEERIGRLESEMLARLDSIQATIVHREVHRNEDIGAATPPPPLLAPFMPILEAIRPLLSPLGRRVETSFGFYYDEKCSGCGLCERVCLAQKVRTVGGRPVWQEDVPCLGCFACLNYCPQESVQVESTWYLKSHTNTNGRYHHPQIAAGDITRQKTI